MKKEILTKRLNAKRGRDVGPLAGLPATFEDLVLLAMHHYRGEISGPALQSLLTSVLGKTINNGAFYGMIRRLERLKWITSRQGDAHEEETGKARRYLRLTTAGRQALKTGIDIRRAIIKAAEADGEEGRPAKVDKH